MLPTEVPVTVTWYVTGFGGGVPPPPPTALLTPEHDASSSISSKARHCKTTLQIWRLRIRRNLTGQPSTMAGAINPIAKSSEGQASLALLACVAMVMITWTPDDPGV